VGFECYSIGDLILDAGTQEVIRDGTILPVPRLSFKLLLSLARHAPNLVTAEQLEEEVWEGLVIDRGTVNKRVLLLRKSLSKDLDEDPYIAVVRGSGYRLVAPVKRIDCSTNAPVVEEQSPQYWFQRSADTIRTVVIGLLGIVALLALYQGFQDAPVEPGVEVTPASDYPTSTTAYRQKSVAVLPFVDLSDDNAGHYLGDGIAEEVINLLAGMDGLEVAARTSSFAFRNTPATLVEIALRLKVGAVLEGSFRHSDGRIRVTAQLIDARTGYHIWSKNYDRSFDEVFAVQDDIASNIAQTLKLTLDESGQPDSRKSMTADMAAFKLYLKGRELLNDRIHLRVDGLYDALNSFNEAIAQDPKFARAHAGVATVDWLLPSYDRTLQKDAWFEKAEASAKFALELDPESIDALGALAAIYSESGDLEQAAKMFDRIRSLDGRNANIVSWEAMLHIRMGYIEELVPTLSAEYKRDPLNEHIAWTLANALVFSGKSAEAVDVLKELQYFSYRFYYLALASIYSGDYETARGLLRDAPLRSGILPAVYADLLIDGLQEPAKREEVAEKFVSAVERGELDKLVCFEALLVLGSPRVFDLGLDPRNDIDDVLIHTQLWITWAVAIRQDSRFKDWVSKLGYIDFWQKHGWPDRCRPTGLNEFECI
jgi:adenylate cyclase